MRTFPYSKLIPYTAFLTLLGAASLAQAQTTYQWDGGSAGGNVSMFSTTYPNWNPDLTGASDYTGNNFVVSTRTNASNTNRIGSTSGVGNTLTLSGSVNIRSLTFDNSLGYFPSTFLRIDGSGSGSTGRTLTFGTTGVDILKVTGGNDVADANNYVGTVVFSGVSGTGSGTTTISLGYTGQSNVNIVNASDKLYIGSLSSLGDTVDGAAVTISGTGGIAKTGAGTLYLRGSNSFTGGLTITSGTVSIGSVAALGSSASPNADAVVINGGTLQISDTASSGSNRGFKVGSSTGTFRVDATKNLTINGTVVDVASQAGVLIKTGDGTLTLASSNSFTGGLRIFGGTVSVDAVGNLGSAASANTDAVIIDGGTLQFTGGTSASSGNRGFRVGSAGGIFEIASGVTTTLNGNIRDYNSTVGSLTKTGSGTLVLNGSSSYTGGTTVSAGTLQGDSASLKGTIVNNAVLVFNQAVNGIYADDVSGTGSLTKSGAGTLTVSGSLGYSGSTTVSAGTLAVTGSLAGSGVTIASGATLAGTGTISAPTTLSVGAYLASTNLTFNSSLDLTGIGGTGAGSLLFTLTSPGASDLATINGTLSIGSGLLTLADLNLDTTGVSSAGTFTLFQSDRAISGLLGSSGLSTTFGGYTGTLGFSGDSRALQFTVASATPIPEPSTYAVLVSAAALFVFCRRRRG